MQATLSALKSGQPVAQEPLDHSLLLLSDIPGVAVVATFKPGEAVGTSDLEVATSVTSAISALLSLDNDGNRYTGRTRGAGTVSAIDPLHRGDALSLTGLSSGNMTYGSASYESLLDGSGSRFGAAYSALHYILGNDLRALDGHGIAAVASLWLKHPFVRTPNFNVYGQIQFDHKRLDDEIGAAALRTDRHLDDWTASLAGDLRDSLLTGGINTWSIGGTAGRVGFGNASSELADAATSRTRGKFLLWIAAISRLQRLTQKDSLYLSLSGQEANANLDPAEKMVAGGVYTVRAYDMGALSGDTGILASAEFRHDLLVLLQGPVQGVAFVDAQRITINHDVWVAGPNTATLKGAGVGLT